MSSRAWRTALSAATFLACASCAPPAFVFSGAAMRGLAQPYSSTTYRFAEGRVPSGLRVVAYEQPDVPNVELRVTWATGGLPGERPGVRMVASYLLDQLTPGPRALEVVSRRYALGAQYGVGTSFDDLVSVSTIKPSMLVEAVRIESERMEQPAAGLTEALLEQAKAELAYKIELTELAPAAQAQLAFARSFTGGRVKELELTAAQVKEIKLADVRHFLEAVLRPERAILVVAGPVDATFTLRSVVEALRPEAYGVKGKDVQPYRPVVAPLPTVVPGTIKVATTSGPRRLTVSWVLPGAAKGFQSAMLVAKLDLGIQLPTALKEEGQGGQVLRQDILLTQGDDYSTIQVVLDLKPGADLARSQKAVLSAVGDLGRWGDRWRGQIDNRMQEAHFASTMGRVPIDDVARSLRTADEPDPEYAFAEVRRNQSSIDLKRLLADYVTPDRAGVVVFEPPAGTLAEQAPPEVSSSFEPRQVGPSPLGSAAPGRAALQRLPLPGPGQPRRERLPNGLRVVVLPFGKEPFARVALILPGGAAAGGENYRARAALASFAKSLPKACNGMTPGVYTDQIQFAMELRASGVRFALEALSCLRLGRVTAIEEGEMTLALSRGEKAWNLLRDAGQVSTNDSYQGWSERYLRRTFSPEEALLLVVGKVDPEATMAIIRELFGSWKAQEGPTLPWAERRRAPERVAVVLDQPKARTAEATVLVPASLDGATREVLAVAEELPSSRMMRLGLANGLKGGAQFFSRSRGLVALRLRLDGDVERLTRVLGLLLEEVRAAAATPPSETALALAKWNVARGWLYQDSSISSMAFELAALELSREDPGTYGARGQRLAAVEAEAVFAVSRSAQAGHEAVLVSGDQAILVPALEKLGFTPVVIPALKAGETR